MSKIFLPRMKPGAGMGKKSNMKDMDKTMFEIRMSAFFHNILYYSSHVFSYVHAAYMWVRSQFGCKVTKNFPNEQIFSQNSSIFFVFYAKSLKTLQYKM